MRISDWSSDVCSSDLVPIKTTGTATAGISVTRQFCKNRYMITMTSTIASMSVLTTSRSEEHTSELQSLMRISYAVFCLKKTRKYNIILIISIDQNYTYKHNSSLTTIQSPRSTV